MSWRKPLTLDDSGNKQQLQPQDDLEIPINDRVDRLEKTIKTLVVCLLLNGIELPEELGKEL